MNKQNKTKLAHFGSKGFTLIEVLVVIGIIAILAAVVLVAVNPARMFKMARDSQRTSNVNAILNAVSQNIAEHKGKFICEGSEFSLPTDNSTVIRNQTAADGGGIYPGDIAKCLVPDYISSLPVDPLKTGAHYGSVTDYDTGYYIGIDSSGRVTASSTGEITASIAVTR